MRNIFDQYSQEENRLTHALVCALNEDNKLLRQFIHWTTGSMPPRSRALEIVEQRLPGEPELSEEEYNQRGLPDGWIYDQDKWSLLIESKVSASLTNDQLRRHYQTALRRGFEDITLLAIDTIEPKRKLYNGALFKQWSDIYTWLQKQANYSDWAQKTARYMEIAEAKWTTNGYLKEGSLTTFSGIPFNEDSPYNYQEAKRLIRLVMEALRKRNELKKELKIDLSAGGRAAITGKNQDAVWDYLSLSRAGDKSAHTAYPHFTFSIKNDLVYVLVTIPNGIKSDFRSNLLKCEFEGFCDVFKRLNKNFLKVTKKAKGSMPWVEVLQRHYKSQRSTPTIDAKLAYDLRTAFDNGEKSDDVKYQPLWMRATFDALKRKRGNTQIAAGVIFPYSSCEAINKPEILDRFVDVWIGCKPLVERLVYNK